MTTRRGAPLWPNNEVGKTAQISSPSLCFPAAFFWCCRLLVSQRPTGQCLPRSLFATSLASDTLNRICRPEITPSVWPLRCCFNYRGARARTYKHTHTHTRLCSRFPRPLQATDLMVCVSESIRDCVVAMRAQSCPFKRGRR